MSTHNPIHITPTTTTTLEQLPIGQSGFTERKLQVLCYENPKILPIGDIEPIYEDAVPVCMELRVPAGFCDILYINSNGLITLVETKLWRNPEARRKVIGQILDYAKDLTHISYSDFEKKCLEARNGSEKSLFEIVSINNDEIDESRFIDQVTKNLRRGRFLLLIVGDGIRENAQEIADFMNRYANMSFTLAMVEVPIYLLSDDSKIVIPQVTAKTTQIEREVYITADNRLEFAESYKADEKAQTATESEFYKRLGLNVGIDTAAQVKVFVNNLIDDLDMTVSMGSGKRITLSLKDSSASYNLGAIWEDGIVRFYGIVEKPEKLGYANIGESYLTELAKLLNGKFDKSTSKWEWGIKKQGIRPSIKEYMKVAEQWKKLLSDTLIALAEIEY